MPAICSQSAKQQMDLLNPGAKETFMESFLEDAKTTTPEELKRGRARNCWFGLRGIG
jgi:hypothetical protein